MLRPSRMTVMRSATFDISFSLWLIRIEVMPLLAELHQQVEQRRAVLFPTTRR
jgi:hypothetical protein